MGSYILIKMPGKTEPEKNENADDSYFSEEESVQGVVVDETPD